MPPRLLSSPPPFFFLLPTLPPRQASTSAFLLGIALHPRSSLRYTPFLTRPEYASPSQPGSCALHRPLRFPAQAPSPQPFCASASRRTGGFDLLDGLRAQIAGMFFVSPVSPKIEGRLLSNYSIRRIATHAAGVALSLCVILDVAPRDLR
ncbi:hypothetical protein B0H13DRAFT_2341851 [Mycena leptocephala]|nr:hypothetical protein B0H13DRAFT_2341851 [Mycena leptocephala]